MSDLFVSGCVSELSVVSDLFVLSELSCVSDLFVLSIMLGMPELSGVGYFDS